MLTPRELRNLKRLVPLEDERLPPIFRALSDPNRCRVVRMLTRTGRKNLSVTEIAQFLHVSAPTASEHLRILEERGILARMRRKQHVYYHIRRDDPIVSAIISVVKSGIA